MIKGKRYLMVSTDIKIKKKPTPNDNKNFQIKIRTSSTQFLSQQTSYFTVQDCMLFSKVQEHGRYA